MLWSADATMEVVKSVESLSTLVIEDGSLQKSEISQKFAKMLAKDMEVVSLFAVDENTKSVAFESAVQGDARYVLRYRLQSDGNGGINADVKLFQDTKEVFVKNYQLKQSEMAVFLSHTIAYDINAKLGGSPMEWIKRKVVFVRLTSPRNSELVVSDYTLSYQKVILRGGMFGFPKWANTVQTELYYTSLSDFKPTIYKLNLQNGEKEKILSSDGMAVCSDVSSDGGKLLVTLAPGGQPDIYLYEVAGGSKIRVTDYSGIDVNGQFMGDGSIAFVSNRMGYPNVFSTRMGSSAVSQLIHYGKNNSSLSSYKNFLVYKARESSGTHAGNTFNLHLLSLNSGNVQRLTASGENDFPRFSRDGEAILYIKQEGSRSSIGLIRFALNKNFSFPLKIGRIQSIDW